MNLIKNQNNRYSIQNIVSESIYNILPPGLINKLTFKIDPSLKQKIKLYVSKFSPFIPPTSSTICNKTSSLPYVSNVSGSLVYQKPFHSVLGQASTFGKPQCLLQFLSQDFFQDVKIVSPSEYLRKNHKMQISKSLGNLKEETRIYQKIKPPIPSRFIQPIYGLKTSKNYLIANAAEIILSCLFLNFNNYVFKAPPIYSQPIGYLQKKNYGEVPQYLQNIKSQLAKELEIIKQIQMEKEGKQNQKILLSEQEVNQLRQNLKLKWDEINHEYQKYTHKTAHTIGLLKKDMQILSKKYVFVDKSS